MNHVVIDLTFFMQSSKKELRFIECAESAAVYVAQWFQESVQSIHIEGVISPAFDDDFIEGLALEVIPQGFTLADPARDILRGDRVPGKQGMFVLKEFPHAHEESADRIESPMVSV
jgi:hypothetical protein